METKSSLSEEGKKLEKKVEEEMVKFSMEKKVDSKVEHELERNVPQGTMNRDDDDDDDHHHHHENGKAEEGKSKLGKRIVETLGEFRFVMDLGDADQVEALLEQGANPNSSVPTDPYRPIHYALVKKRFDYVSSLVYHGADLNCEDELGRLPLLYACRSNLADCARVLIRGGADTQRPLNDRLWTSLHVCAHVGNLETALILLEEAPHLINATSRTNDTPLHLAARAGHVEIVRALIQHDANLDTRTFGKGHTALHCAAQHGRPVIAQLLIDAGADIYAKEFSSTKRSALRIARDFRNNGCIVALVRKENELQHGLQRTHMAQP